MTRPSPLDDPRNAQYAWARYRRLMKIMAAVSALVALAVCGFMYVSFGFLSIHFYIATALGVWFTMMLGSALMALVFLSSGTGHDQSIEDPLDDD